MAKLTDLPTELIQAIMDAAHPMPHGQLDSRHPEQTPAAMTFGALRLTCREMNLKVFKRYVECLFSVHTVMLEETSLQTLLDLAENDHFRDALGTLFIDTRSFAHAYHDPMPKHAQHYLRDILIPQHSKFMDSHSDREMFLRVLQTFPNLKEISIEHVTTQSSMWVKPRMISLGANAIQKLLGSRAEIGSSEYNLQAALHSIFIGIGAAEKELADLQIRIVTRSTARAEGDCIDWGHLEQVTHEVGLTTDFLELAMKSPDHKGVKLALQGLKTLALPVRGPTLDIEEQYGHEDGWEFQEFQPNVVADFIALSPNLEDLTLYFATGNDQALVDIKHAIPWSTLPNLWAIELGGARLNYRDLIAGLTTLKHSLRHFTLRHVQLASANEWISLIRFLHTEMSLTDFEIWEPAEENGKLCFRNLKGKCYQPYRSWRVKKILPENLEKYLADLKETKLHRAEWSCPWAH
jgi:hypothetical protein